MFSVVKRAINRGARKVLNKNTYTYESEDSSSSSDDDDHLSKNTSHRMRNNNGEDENAKGILKSRMKKYADDPDIFKGVKAKDYEQAEKTIQQVYNRYKLHYDVKKEKKRVEEEEMIEKAAVVYWPTPADKKGLGREWNNYIATGGSCSTMFFWQYEKAFEWREGHLIPRGFMVLGKNQDKGNIYGQYCLRGNMLNDAPCYEQVFRPAGIGPCDRERMQLWYDWVPIPERHYLYLSKTTRTWFIGRTLGSASSPVAR